MARLVRLLVLLVSVAVLLVTTVRGAGDSALTKAVKAGDLAGAKKLIAARADVNAPGGDGSTPLLWAAHQSDIEMARTLIAAGAKPDAQAMDRHLFCPTCNARLFNRSCKWWCPTCGYHESCADM